MFQVEGPVKCKGLFAKAGRCLASMMNNKQASVAGMKSAERESGKR